MEERTGRRLEDSQEHVLVGVADLWKLIKVWLEQQPYSLELDRNLESILDDFMKEHEGVPTNVHITDDYIPLIKLAFLGAGWVPPEDELHY